jgi:hypothetical protein
MSSVVEHYLDCLNRRIAELRVEIAELETEVVTKKVLVAEFQESARRFVRLLRAGKEAA